MAKATIKETIKEEGKEGKGVRNFRALPEIEAFYRMVHDNDLRLEAHKALEFLVSALKKPKKRGRKSKKKILQ